MTRIFSIPYSFVVPANSSANQSSNIISNIQQLIGAVLIFPPGTGSLLIYQFREASGQPSTTTSQVGGRDINQDYVQNGYYVGDGIAYPVPWQKLPEQTTEVVIMNAINNTGIALTAAAIVWVSQA